MRALFFLAISVVCLSGCSVKTTGVCSNSGGSCCALAYTTDTAGNPNYSVYQCVPSCAKCPPEGASGTPKCPESSPPNGYCDAEYRTVWAWESDFWDALTFPASTPLAAKGPPAIAATNPGFCKAACETGNLAFCQFAVVPNDVSVGLLSLIVKLAANADSSSHVIPIADVIRDFRVKDGLQACARNDVVVDKGVVRNTGQKCLSLVRPKSIAGAAIRADLAASDNITADIISSSGLALFPQEQQGFELKFEDTGLQNAFGGFLSVAAQSFGTDIAVTIKRENQQPPCADVRPDVVVRSDFHRLVRTAAAKPSLLDNAIDDLKTAAAKLPADAPASSNQEKSISADYPKLAPLLDEFDAMMQKLPAVDSAAVARKRYTADIGGMNSVVNARQLLMLVDMHLCHSQIASAGDVGPEHFYPELDLSASPSEEFVSFRNKQAGRYLLCRFGYDALPATLKTSLEQAAKKLVR